jgi:hypothetical protein
VKRVLLALIPVAILATASLALTGITPQPLFVASRIDSDDATIAAEAAPPSAPSPVTVHKAVLAQPTNLPDGEQIAQTQEAEEPLPELVVDKTPLNDAMAALLKAIEQSKLAATALDAGAQARYIQETLNLLAGAGNANFSLVAQSDAADSYKGVQPLLVQARVVREAAEVQWIAAVQRQMEAQAKKLADLAQAGSSDGTVPPPATSNEIVAMVGPTGVLGTRGVRPEEQAHELVTRAIRQAAEALRFASATSQPSAQDGGTSAQHVSDDATQMIEAVTRILETAQKILKIAAER